MNYASKKSIAELVGKTIKVKEITADYFLFNPRTGKIEKLSGLV